VSEDSDQRSVRLAKLEALRNRGLDPFRIERFPRTHTAGAIVADADALDGVAVSVAGRVTALRAMGKASFVDLDDETGRIQIYARRDDLGEDAYQDLRNLDIGDIAGVTGTVFRTRTGEISVHAHEWTLLAKCLRPLPIGKEYDGARHVALSDPETRHRRRYLDFIVHPEARALLAKRARMVSAIRRFLDDRGYVETETPVLQTIAGGAAARPFTTYHNALSSHFKLRISLELPLKRLVVGGFPRVYEIGRVFRNEGVSTRHNPEFTLLEMYEAYSDLDDMMETVEEMYEAACIAVNGSPVFAYAPRAWSAGSADAPASETVEVDVSRRPWRRLSMLDGIAQYAAVSKQDLATLDDARATCLRLGLDAEAETSVGGIVEKIHERFVQPHLIEPTFITDFPVETSPLAKRRADDPSLTRRFEIYMASQELGNAFSEINDPLDQRDRFEDQMRQRATGNEEAHPMDEDFVWALECGMPPTAGLGVGIDRLIMVLAGAPSIREVIAFPLVRTGHD